MENVLEYALAARTEHRSDGDYEYKMKIPLNCALATSKPVSEHRSDGEVVAIPNTFKEALETPQAAKWKEAADKEMASLETHVVFDLVPSASVPSETKIIGTKWFFTVKADPTLK